MILCWEAGGARHRLRWCRQLFDSELAATGKIMLTGLQANDKPASRLGSGANLKGSAPGGNGWDDGTDLGTGSLQGSTFRPRNHHPVYQVVPDVQTQLP